MEMEEHKIKKALIQKERLKLRKKKKDRNQKKMMNHTEMIMKK